MINREKRRTQMQVFIKAGGPGIKLKSDFEKLNRDIVTINFDCKNDNELEFTKSCN